MNQLQANPVNLPGYFGVGVWHPKREVNIGTLWRSAVAFDAAFLVTIGRRYQGQASDTCNARGRLPLIECSDIEDLVNHLPHGTPLIAVEMADGAIPLPEFEHPRRAVYLLGAEDHGLSSAVLDRAHYVVQIPSHGTDSLNVATAGSLVLYDRWTKAVRS